MNFLRGQHKFCSFWSCVPTFLYGRLHRFWRRKTERERKGKYITSPALHREKKFCVWERKIKLNFYFSYWSMPQWIFWEENISFVVFGAVYWPFSMVDYTERRKTERKNVSNEHYITGPPQREEILRERKMKRFSNLIKQNYTERRKTERKKENVPNEH